jgi:hypothetical protein
MPEAVSPGVKRPGNEADHSPILRVEVKIEWSYAFHYLMCLHCVTETASPIIIIIIIIIIITGVLQ